MRTRWIVSGVLTAALLATVLSGPAQAQQLPRSVTIGTIPPGTLFYALAQGVDAAAGRGSERDHPVPFRGDPVLQAARGLEAGDGPGAAKTAGPEPVARRDR